MEGDFEDDSQLRRCVENELISEPSISPEQALKVYQHIKINACIKLKKNVLLLFRIISCI